jgi:serine/threonine-protein kinase
MPTNAQRIGRYQIVGELGRGAMGVVLRAFDPSIGRIVALKTIRLTASSKEEGERHVERLRREAKTAGRLSHPNIVTVFDFFEEGAPGQETAYVCMECINGPALEQTLNSGKPLSPSTVLHILGQCASALDYAHQKGVIHRDIKPGNIMLHEDRQVKIADFGIAKVLNEDATMTGTLFGTPNYMSPEQVQSLPLDGKSDQFSLAVVAYELLTGEKPFQAYSMAAIVYKVCHEAPVPPSQINASLGTAVDAVLGKALAKRPAERFPAAAEFVSSLQAALQQSPGWMPMVRGQASSAPTATEIPVVPAEARAERPGEWSLAGWLTMIVSVTAVLVLFFVWLISMPERGATPAGDAAVAVPEAAKPRPASEPASPPPDEAPQQDQPPETKQPGGDETAAASRPEEAAGTSARDEKSARAANPAPPAADSARVTASPFAIETLPAGAAIQVDGNPAFTCTAPCEITLAPGRHLIRAELNGHRLVVRSVDVPRDEKLRIVLERQTGTVMVRSNPPGASIVVDGQEWATRTPTMLTLPAGRHQLVFRRDGYAPQESSIVVRDGAVANLDINWVPQ